MYGHLSRDPYPKRVLVDQRPHLKAWVERMNAPQVGAGQFLPDDAIPATLQPVFDAIFTEFYPMVAGIQEEVHQALPKLAPGRKRLPRVLGMIEFPMGEGRYRRGAMPYTLWMMQRVLDAYRALDSASRASVDAWLAKQDAGEAMRFDIGARLKRVGLHVALES